MIGQSRWRIVAVHGAVALLAAACGLAFAPAFGGRLAAGDVAPAGIVVAVLVGALVPAAAVAAARVLRAPPLLAAAAGLVASAVAITATAGGVAAVFSGPQRLLTSALPATPDAAARGAVAAVVAFASLVAAMLAGYARVRALAVVPCLACLLAALALDAGAGARQPPTWYAALVVVLVGISLAALGNPLRVEGSRAKGTRWVRATHAVAGSAVILAVGAAVAVGLSAALPAVRHDAADAQNLVSAPLRPRAAVQPMAQYPAFADGADTVRLDGTSSVRLSELPMVTLSTFTGQTWTTTTRFRRAGRTLRVVPPAQPVTVSITATDAQNLSWLVRPDEPSRIDVDGLGTDAATGDLIVPAGAHYPQRYRVVGSAALVPTVAESADQPVARAGPVATDPRAVPASIASFAAGARPSGSGYLQLITLQNRLRGFRLATGPSAQTGSGYLQLENLLKTHRGTGAQYASAFAVAARVLGYDSRVVLGFRPEYAPDGHTFTLSGKDIHAWAQVRFERAGWVTFDPTPTQVANAPAESPPQQTSPTSSGSSRAATVPPAQAKPSTPAARAGSSGGSGLPAGLLAIPALLVAAVLAAPLIKSCRRRRRRRAAAPAHAVHGAWRETRDRLVEVGAPVRAGWSTGQVADAAPHAVRAEVRALGAVLDRAGYAPEAARPADAAAAWSYADRAAGKLRAHMPAWRRALATLDPRPLRRGL